MNLKNEKEIQTMKMMRLNIYIITALNLPTACTMKYCFLKELNC